MIFYTFRQEKTSGGVVGGDSLCGQGNGVDAKGDRRNGASAKEARGV